MTDKHIFPDSVLDQSSDQIFSEKSRLSGVLYLLVLFTVVAVLIAINFISVDVHVNGTGIIKPREDHTVITTTSSGFVTPYNLAPNTHVSEGDTLLIVKSELITSKLPMLRAREEELNDLIFDLQRITRQSPYNVKLKSPVYKQDVLYYVSQWNEADAKRKQAKAAYERSKKLYEADVIPLAEFEPVELEYIQSENAIQKLTGYQKRQWQSDLINYETELRDIETQIEQIGIQNAETVICSPVTGTIQQVQALFEGSYVQAGQQVVEISPDGDLIAECYIMPKDIGYMRTGMTGRVLVSAFNYNEWGFLNGTVEEIFDDVTVSADGAQTFYKIYCSLDSDHLSLKNGYDGYIKKGMVVNANFKVVSRTIFQLLYDKVDNWLNPNITDSDE